MARLFYHVMQDSFGNLLFDVYGTMRLAGSGTLATIYGDDAMTIPIPNPMINHAAYGSFKCYLGPGAYDFYMDRSGYTFETMTGLQGAGTMAQQNASDVAITGGDIAGLTYLSNTGTSDLADVNAANLATTQAISVGTTLIVTGTSNLAGAVTCGATIQGTRVGIGLVPRGNVFLDIRWSKAAGTAGIILQQMANDANEDATILFANSSGTTVGTIVNSNTATAYNTASDGCLKDAITPLTGALDVMRALNPVSFLWKADGSPGRGLVAQEVAGVVPGVVSGDEASGDVLGIDYSKLVPYLIGAVKELTQQVDTLTAKLATAGT